MKLEAFQISMYKSILDSGWVEVENLTTLIGKNESGKTSLLKALHKFNPFKQEPYNIEREWPRGYRSSRNKDHPVCAVRFSLTDEESEEFTTALGLRLLSKTSVVCTRRYSGSLSFAFSPEIPEAIHRDDLSKAQSKLLAPTEPVGGPFRDAAQQLVGSLIEHAANRGKHGLENAAVTYQGFLSGLLTGEASQEISTNERKFIEDYPSIVSGFAKALAPLPTLRNRAEEFVKKRLPTFIYMDEYRAFNGSAYLDQVRQRKNAQQSTEEDKTLCMILELSGLDLSRLASQGEQEDREQRQYDLSDAGLTLSKEIEGRWKQKKYEVSFSADSQHFFTFVKDEKDSALIRLEERSKGFQWFFSFDLMLMYESKGSFKNCVILLDEPGLHLHPEAQANLLERLERYAEGNMLIYSTHLPFMIDLQRPERIRVISEGEGANKGTFVTNDLNLSQPEGKLTLQAALGIGGRSSYLVSQQNLVVEGVDDYWILSALSNLSERSGKPGLSEGVLITAAGGASEVTYIATFMVGQELSVVALYDTDASGNVAKDKLVNQWLTRYKGRIASALSLGQAVGSDHKEFAIEDLFPEDFYLKYVTATYAKGLKTAGIDTIILSPGSQLVKRVEEFFKSNNLHYNKGSVAKRICADLNRMPKLEELPGSLREMTSKLLSTINEAFSESKAVSKTQ